MNRLITLIQDPDWSMGKQGWDCILCRLLDWVQKDHCKNSIGV